MVQYLNTQDFPRKTGGDMCVVKCVGNLLLLLLTICDYSIVITIVIPGHMYFDISQSREVAHSVCVCPS